MGTYYYYSLRTKRRTFQIGGVAADVYAVEFAHKYEPRSYALREANMQRAWDHRDPPQYIAFGGLEDGSSVYRGWPENTITVSEYITDGLEFVGILRGSGRAMKLEEWTPVRLGRKVEDRYATIKMLADLGLDPYNFAVRVGLPSRNETVVVFKNPNDAVIGRVALA